MSSAAVVACANTRYTYTRCLHIRLARCALHPVDEDSLSCTCPRPKVGFSSVIVEGECAACLLAGARSRIEALEQRLEQVSGAKLDAVEVRIALCTDLSQSMNRAEHKKRLGMRSSALDSVRWRIGGQIEVKKVELEKLQSQALETESIGAILQHEGDEGRGCVVWWTAEVDDGLWKW